MIDVSPKNPFNPEINPIGRPFEDVVVKGRQLIEAGEYGAAFGNLARRMDEISQTQNINDKKIQRDVRHALDDLWKDFRRDIYNRNLMGKRLDFLHEDTLKEVRRGDAEGPQSPEPILASTAKEHIEEFIDESISRVTEDIDRAFENEYDHIAYIGVLYNHVMPMLDTMINEYVKDMIKNQRKPITAQEIRARIVTILDTAPTVAGTLASAERVFEKFTADETDPFKSKKV